MFVCKSDIKGKAPWDSFQMVIVRKLTPFRLPQQISEPGQIGISSAAFALENGGRGACLG